MPDLNEFAVTRTDSANVNVPTHRLSAKVTDSGSGAVLADYTGANSLSWPGVLSTLSLEQQDMLAQQVAQQIILLKAGV